MIDVSQATLDVIEAIKKQNVIQFKYGSHDGIRTIKPESFYGDFNGFQGIDVNTADEFRKFSFDRVTAWVGIPITYKVFVELKVVGYPTDKEVAEELHELLDSAEPIMYTLKPVTD
jgi:hypothetical protein